MMSDKPNPAAAPLCAVWPHSKHIEEENLCVHQVFSTMCTTSSLNQPNACQWGRTPAQLLAEWFFSFQLCENEEAPGGWLLWEPACHPLLFCMSLLWVLSCCWLCALLLPEVRELLTCWQVSLGFFAPRKCTSNKALFSEGPTWGSPQHVLAFRLVHVPCLPSTALVWTIWQHTTDPNGTLFSRDSRRSSAGGKACVNWHGPMPIYIKGKSWS